ncbi:MAG: type IV pilin N-terminal domain-containing protein [Methanoregula sp.]|nr:type IV pilin N-terminal domain-containing protein [Methanoregula sp.]
MRPGKNHADAVSPVVGVMLMLAVTVMIAAIVSTYAGGFSGGAEKSPQSSIRVTPNVALHRIYFEHNGGDPFTLRSINVILRSGDNKTSLSALDAGGSKIKAFEEVGDSGDTALKAGDTFFIEGEGTGSDAGIKFGSMILTNNTKITWLVVDKETSKTISMGSFFL